MEARGLTSSSPEHFGFIYITTNLVNNKKYIGQKAFRYSDGTETNWLTYFGSGKIFLKALEKYGKENFKREIVYFAKDSNELNLAERVFIRARNAKKSSMYYNLTDGGEGIAGFKFNEEQLNKRRGTNNHMYGRRGKSHPSYGKHNSLETRKKISKVQSDGRNKGANNPMARPVALLKNEEIFIRFQSVKPLWEYAKNNFPKPNSPSTISKCIKTGKEFHGFKIIYLGDDIMGMTKAAVARLCHEVNRAYCLSMGDNSQVHWNEAPVWQQASAIQGVEYHLEHPLATPMSSHYNWMEDKMADGWTYGPVKDPEKKEHPCIVPYEKLPDEQKAKDYIFKAICDYFRGAIIDA